MRRRDALHTRSLLMIPAGLALVLGALVLHRHQDTATASMLSDADYVVVSGASGLGDDQLLWILDTRSRELVVAGWDNTAKGLVGHGTRSVSGDLESLRRRR